MHLHVHDVFQPFARDKHSIYDVVHVRYFSTLVDRDSLHPLIQNLISLLSMLAASQDSRHENS